MESIERITSEIRELEEESARVANSIQELENATTIDFLRFGGRKEVLKEYLRDKGIHLPYFLARVRDEALFSYKKSKELSELKDIKNDLYIMTERAKWLLSLASLNNEENKDSKLRRYLSQTQIEDIMLAYRIIKETPNKNIQTLLIRGIKDVLSICRYIEIFNGNAEYEVTEQLYSRIDSLRALIYHTSEYKEHKSECGYIKGQDCMPKMYRSIEGSDISLYKEIMRLLWRIKSGTIEGEELLDRNHIKYYQAISRNVKIVYGIKDGNIVIYDLVNFNKMTKPDGINYPGVIHSVESFFSNPIDNETQSAYDTLINNQLDLSKNKQAITKRIEKIKKAQKER